MSGCPSSSSHNRAPRRLPAPIVDIGPPIQFRQEEFNGQDAVHIIVPVKVADVAQPFLAEMRATMETVQAEPATKKSFVDHVRHAGRLVSQTIKRGLQTVPGREKEGEHRQAEVLYGREADRAKRAGTEGMDSDDEEAEEWFEDMMRSIPDYDFQVYNFELRGPEGEVIDITPDAAGEYSSLDFMMEAFDESEASRTEEFSEQERVMREIVRRRFEQRHAGSRKGETAGWSREQTRGSSQRSSQPRGSTVIDVDFRESEGQQQEKLYKNKPRGARSGKQKKKP